MAITRIGNIASTIPDDSIQNAKFSNIVQSKNIIINGDMSIAQRETSQASITSSGYYTLDRARTAINNGGTWTQSQSTEVPSGQGFATSLKMDCTTADSSLASGDFLHVQYPIEAQNLQYLKFGTANAQTLTLSFWVRSNKTGTYCICLQKSDNTRYDYVAEYSISSADTWEKKTITIAPDSNIKAAGGAIDNDNGEGFKLKFILLSSGRTGTNNTWNSSTPADATSNQVNLADSTSNEWYITGVQLEAGTTASDFEFLPVDVNLTRCQRYYYLHTQRGGSFEPLAMGYYFDSTNLIFLQDFPVQMRSHPSLISGSGTNYYRFDYNSTNDLFNSLTLSMSYNTNALFYNNSEVSGTGGMAGGCYLNSDGAFLAFSSEL